MRLHKIASNSKKVLQAFDQEDIATDLRNIQINEHELHLQKSLGISWDLVTDCFTFTVPIENRPFTRRGILSVVNRLELCSAVLGLELAEFICDQLDLDISTVKFFSDSQVVLGYINNETRRFYVYVTNRIDRIRKSAKPSQWSYVTSEENPADQGTRKINVTQLQDSMWLNGPPFMYCEKSQKVNLKRRNIKKWVIFRKTV